MGTWFQAPSNFEGALFWDDDYETGSFKKWLKEKYTGPYKGHGFYDWPSAARADVQEILDRFQRFPVQPLVTLTLEEMKNSLTLETQVEFLMESLKLSTVLSKLSPVILYTYDFGDNWQVTIEKANLGRVADLVQAKVLKLSDLEAASRLVVEEHRPVCIYRRGLSVLDDVGGLSGFAGFLEKINGSGDAGLDSGEDGSPFEDGDSVASWMLWAKGQGWSPRRVSAKATL